MAWWRIKFGGIGVPCSTARYCEKPDPGPSGDLICVGKPLILRDLGGQIPYAAEQGNKSGEQGDKINDQRIKSAEHGKAPTGQIGAAV
jgi:hypothetical protein